LLGSFRSACTSGISLMKPSPSSIPGRRFPESAWGSSFLRHGTVKEAFAAKDAFQKAAASGGHSRIKIVTLKDQLALGQPVQPAHLAESK
jgi:hypothetical protein